jgi:dihydropteroate synthase
MTGEGLRAWMERRERPLVMGILNVTPDSFFDGGRLESASAAVTRGLEMIEEGADILDVGGESTRPGARPAAADEEMARVLPVIEGIRSRSDIALSIDTTKADVATGAIAAGASVVNDITALRLDPDMAHVVAASGVLVVLMHMQGTPETMQQDPHYEDPTGEVKAFLIERIGAAVDAGIERASIIADPGIGFGKRLGDNLALLRDLERLKSLGVPILIGLSRKSFLGGILDLPAEERLEGTIAANAIAVARGADIIRVHDVREGRRAADVAHRLRRHED